MTADAEMPSPAVDVERTTLLDRLTRSAAMRWFLNLSLMRKVLSLSRGDRAIHKFVRYSMVSGVAIVISQVTILICAGVFHLSGILANTIGALAATPASYELNRKWAWGKRGKSHLWKEVAPFWGLTLIGYLASTGTVQLADNICHSHHVTGLGRAFAIMGASLYGVVWIAKFIIFNKLVFASKAPLMNEPAKPPVVPAAAPPNSKVAGNGGTTLPDPAGTPVAASSAVNVGTSSGFHATAQPPRHNSRGDEAVGALEAPGPQ